MRGEKTLIIVAHRLSTIKNCDYIFFLENGSISSVGTYKELLKNSTGFQKLAKE